MTYDEALYDVQEQTGNLAHAPIDNVCDRLLSRVTDPREDLQDAPFVSTMEALVDQYGEEAVQEVVRRILGNQLSYRTAATDRDMCVWIGTTVGWLLWELNSE